MCYRPALILVLASAASFAQDLVQQVRTAIGSGNFRAAEAIIEKAKAEKGTTPEMIEGVSWLGRGALAAKQLDNAYAYAERARELSLAQLKTRKLDAETHLPLALGASIEVQSQVLAQKGELGQAVAFLREELETYRATSIRTRIQKNLHLLSLEGKPAPTLEMKSWLGPKTQSLAALKGKPLVLFFWAHWCSTCKGQIPDLVKVASEYGPKGLVVLGPTQHYGYTPQHEEASREQESAHIDSIRKQHYAGLPTMTVPVSEENFKNYGASTTPTLVFVDTKGIVQVYHPGAMSYAELAQSVAKILPRF